MFNFIVIIYILIAILILYNVGKEDIMENPKAISEILNQAKKIEDNNFSNMEYSTSINMLLASSDLGGSKDKELSNKFNKLNKKIEDINELTSELLSDLASRHN